MPQPKEMILIFPLSTTSHRTRLTKLVSIANSLNILISSWAWERNKGDFAKEQDFPFVERRKILKGGGYNSKWIKLYYPLWVLSVALNLLIKRPKSPVYCLGFETALPAWLVSKIIHIEYIFDDADRFSMIVKLPKVFHDFVRKIEEKVSQGAVVNIIPGYERYEFRNKKQRVLKNMPDSSSLSKSRTISINRPSSKLVIYVNGWMGETRGLPIMLELAKRCLPHSDTVHFIAAGNAEDKSAKEFISLSNVTYLGSVTNEEALAWYRASDFVFTYYDPVIEINRYAESNKWGDALALNVPIIVNNEVLTAGFLRKSNICISVAYDDIDLLEIKINEILENPSILEKMKHNIQQVISKIEYFDSGMKQILKEVYYDKATQN